MPGKISQARPRDAAVATDQENSWVTSRNDVRLHAGRGHQETLCSACGMLVNKPRQGMPTGLYQSVPMQHRSTKASTSALPTRVDANQRRHSNRPLRQLPSSIRTPCTRPTSRNRRVAPCESVRSRRAVVGCRRCCWKRSLKDFLHPHYGPAAMRASEDWAGAFQEDLALGVCTAAFDHF